MKTLLVPVDFSNASGVLIERAGGLARDLGARLVLLHVVEPVATSVPVGASMDILTAAPPPEPVDTGVAEARLKALAAGLSGLTVDCRAVLGIASEDILACAGEEGADYIVMASHGHGALYHLFSGSVVTGVLKRAACPVIIVPARHPAKE